MSNLERSLAITLWVMIVGGFTLAFFIEADFAKSAVWLTLTLVVFIGGWTFYDEAMAKKKRR